MTETTTTVEPGTSGNGHANGNGDAAKQQPKVLPANPLKALEAKHGKAVTPATAKPVKGKAAAKPAAAKPAATKPTATKPAASNGGAVRFTAAFTRTFTDWLTPHGYKQAPSPKPAIVVFEKNGTRIEITNPSRPGGSKYAPFTVIRKSGKPASGEGRDALATVLSVPRVRR